MPIYLDEGVMPETHMDLQIHHAQPEVHQSRELIWISVRLDPAKIMGHMVTMFLVNPDVALDVGRRLVQAAERAKRVADALKEPKADVATFPQSLRDA
jgi:hypothetical protein